MSSFINTNLHDLFNFEFRVVDNNSLFEGHCSDSTLDIPQAINYCGCGGNITADVKCDINMNTAPCKEPSILSIDGKEVSAITFFVELIYN